MTAFGNANYEAYREFNYGKSAVTGEPIPEWDDLPVHIKSGWSAGADAVALVLAECPVNDDAPGSGPQPAKVIVVTEVRGKSVIERRYDANQADPSEYGQLRILRKGAEVGGYQANGWLSWREDGATVPDATVAKLGIAVSALNRAGRELGTDAEDAAKLMHLSAIIAKAFEGLADVDL